jgi:hypothetical protein
VLDMGEQKRNFMIKLYYDCCGKEADHLLEKDPIYHANITVLGLEKELKQCPECARKQCMAEMGFEGEIFEDFEVWLEKLRKRISV